MYHELWRQLRDSPPDGCSARGHETAVTAEEKQRPATSRKNGYEAALSWLPDVTFAPLMWYLRRERSVPRMNTKIDKQDPKKGQRTPKEQKPKKQSQNPNKQQDHEHEHPELRLTR
jgi:hypothetical protein